MNDAKFATSLKAFCKKYIGYLVIVPSAIMGVLSRWLPDATQYRIGWDDGVHLFLAISPLGLLISWGISIFIIFYLYSYHEQMAFRKKMRILIISAFVVCFVALIAGNAANSGIYGHPRPFLWMHDNQISRMRMDLLPFALNTFFVYIMGILFSKLLASK